MSILKKTILIFACVLPISSLLSQEDLLSLIDDNKEEGPKKVYATFKTVRIGNAQTIETVKKKHLDFRISHRFGNIYDSNLKNPINETFQTFLGFDNASDIRISFDYGLLDNLTVGIGRSKLNKLADASLKWKILQQTTNFSMPISLAFFTSVGYSHAPTSAIYAGVVKDFKTNEAHRFNYFSQLIIASKLTEWLSLELLPSYMHRNFIKENINTDNGNAQDVNGFFSMGIGGRIKLTKRLSFIGDYFYNAAAFYQGNSKVFNPLSLGFEIETGGHVFSLFYTNASGLTENNFIPYTTDTWSKGQVKFGFCISRTFAL
ncbi:DUF5777 family beta-barrel protein [Aurantibacillus circumpalustris]|uniref:DUF5777 family beta-barrel protein n=1 Tax=Aurantibacillus circumpalustris TaxID=3036359 RepID=UPI00295A6940|nr:DUF5777 family beta-barrel protein [Aurantibacillus circumpalustris]